MSFVRYEGTTIDATSRADSPTWIGSSSTMPDRISSSFHVAVSHVAVVERRIVGFATVCAGTLAREGIPDERLSRRMPGYPLPVLRLARLGVDVRVQGLGIGTHLLRHVLSIAIRQRDAIGCIGVVTDAKPDAMRFYESYGFSALSGVREGALHGEPTPMFLPMAAIAAAASSTPPKL